MTTLVELIKNLVDAGNTINNVEYDANNPYVVHITMTDSNGNTSTKDYKKEIDPDTLEENWTQV